MNEPGDETFHHPGQPRMDYPLLFDHRTRSLAFSPGAGCGPFVSPITPPENRYAIARHREPTSASAGLGGPLLKEGLRRLACLGTARGKLVFDKGEDGLLGLRLWKVLAGRFDDVRLQEILPAFREVR